jgi:hypothetical protein
MTAIRKSPATLKERGSQDGQRKKLPRAGARQRRPNRANDSTARVGNTDELVAGRGVPAASDTVRLHPAGCRPGQRADAVRSASGDIANVAQRLIVRAVTATFVATRRLPLNETVDLDIDKRLQLGDLEAVHDMARDAISELETLADRVAGLLCDEPDAMRRLAEVRIRQDRTGKPWYGEAISGSFKEAAATDRGGKEPRGAGHCQEQPRLARAGEPAKKRSR